MPHCHMRVNTIRNALRWVERALWSNLLTSRLSFSQLIMQHLVDESQGHLRPHGREEVIGVVGEILDRSAHHEHIQAAHPLPR